MSRPRNAPGAPVRTALIGLIGAASTVAAVVFGGCSTADESAIQPVGESAARPVDAGTVDESTMEQHEAAMSQLDATASFAVTIRDGVPTVFHGVGPKGVAALRDGLARRGLGFST